MDKELSESKVQKILIMGNSKVGKSSMRSIIFSNLSPKDTYSLGLTDYVASHQIDFIGGLTLKLLDCGGQNELKQEYLQEKNWKMFSNVKILIFVLEAEAMKTSNEEKDDDLIYFEKILFYLSKYSTKPKIFCLINKMDLISKQRKQAVFERRKLEIFKRTSGYKYEVECFPTSIWDNSLIRAWTSIISSLVLDIDKLKCALESLREACNAFEIIIFEKNSILPLCNVSSREIKQNDRFEKISQYVKRAKLSYNMAKRDFISLFINAKKISIYLDDFTSSSYIMIAIEGPSINVEMLALNIELSRKYFEAMVEHNQYTIV